MRKKLFFFIFLLTLIFGLAWGIPAYMEFNKNMWKLKGPWKFDPRW